MQVEYMFLLIILRENLKRALTNIELMGFIQTTTANTFKQVLISILLLLMRP
jgi:hypothetical protein